MSGAESSSPPPAVQRRRLPSSEQGERLRAIIARIASVKPQGEPVVVFDLDGTLMDNRPRSAVILHQLADHWRAPHPDLAERLAAMHPDGMQYFFRENLRLLGIQDAALVAEAIEFWRVRFFTDDFLRYDRAAPGAPAFARQCYDAGARLCYFTGRDLPNMALGSLASLRDLGFPIGTPGTELVFKPSKEMSDFDFKREVTPRLSRGGVVVAAFDNEPQNCNLFREHFAYSDVYLVDTQHLPDAPELDVAVRVIGDFRI